VAALHARKHAGNLGRRLGQLFDHRLHLPAQRVGAECERSQYASHDNERTDDARDLELFEPSDKRIQRV
jgi:hypothetical protein